MVIRNVEADLPSSGFFTRQDLLLTDKNLEGDKRYRDWNYDNYRSIERSVRNPKDCLL